jgi:hypothetical protein
MDRASPPKPPSDDALEPPPGPRPAPARPAYPADGHEAARRWNRDLRNTVRDAASRAEAAADCFKKHPGTPKAPEGR